MKKKMIINRILLMVGLILAGIGLAYGLESFKIINGLLIGFGSGIFGGCLGKELLFDYEKKHPQQAKLNKIEYNDERSQLIRLKAKVSAGKVISWIIIIFAYFMIIMNEKIYITLSLVGIYSLYYILSWIYVIKYQKTL